jgi:advillin
LFIQNQSIPQNLKRQKEAQFASEETKSAPAETPSAVAPIVVASAGGTYTKEQLLAGPIAGVDSTRKEDYLSPEEFNAIFGQDKVSFYAMPKWKQQAKKKDVGLF